MFTQESRSIHAHRLTHCTLSSSAVAFSITTRSYELLLAFILYCLVWIFIFSLYVPAIKAGLEFDKNYTYEWKFRNDITWVSVAKYSLQFRHCHHLFADRNAKLTLSAEAILHALIIIRSSIRLSFTSPLPVCDYKVDQYSCISGKAGLQWGMKGKYEHWQD